MAAASERRHPETPRVQLGAEIFLSPKHWDERIPAAGINLSATGLHLRAGYLPELGSRLTCQFASPISSTPLRAEAEVVWVHPIDALEGEFGLKFVDLPRETYEALLRYVSDQTGETLPELRRTEHSGMRRLPNAEVDLVAAGAAIDVTVAHRAPDAMILEQDLPLLRIGAGVAVRQDGFAEQHAQVASVDLYVENDVPRLVLTVLHAETEDYGFHDTGFHDTRIDELNAEETLRDVPSPRPSGPLPSSSVPPSSVPTINDLELGIAARIEMSNAAVPADGAGEAPIDIRRPRQLALQFESAARTHVASLAAVWRSFLQRLRNTSAWRSAFQAGYARARAWLLATRDAAYALAAKVRFAAAESTIAQTCREALGDLRQKLGLSRRRTTSLRTRTRRNRGLLGRLFPSTKNRVRPSRPHWLNARNGLISMLALGLVWGAWAMFDRPDAAPVVAAVEPSQFAVVPALTFSDHVAVNPHDVAASAPRLPVAWRFASLAADQGPAAVARVFGNAELHSGRTYRIRMSKPVRGIKGIPESDGFVIEVPGSLALEPAGPIAYADAVVDYAAVHNYGRYAKLYVRFAQGAAPDYRVRGDQSTLEITIN